LQRNRIDVVLAEYGPTGVSVLPVCVESRIPFVVHFHGFDAYDHPTLDEYGDQYREMFKSASAIVAVSRDMQGQLLRLGAPNDKTFYIPYGVDLNLFANANPRQADPVFLAVARFVDKKAPHLTLLAFHKVLAAVPDAKLIMIGDGDLLEASRQLATSLRMNGSVEFRGARSPIEVAEATKSARAFVQHSMKTSYGDSEGTPNTILEAGAAGLAVVSTRHAGIKDVVQEGETGFLIDEGDVDGMAAAMIRLAKDPDLAATMGMAARKRIASHFSLSDRLGELWEVLKTAAKKATT
jgi:glycosyltransferase involved in cell wall biosynthesis